MVVDAMGKSRGHTLEQCTEAAGYLHDDGVSSAITAPSPPCMRSRRVQCAEARIVMELRRARCARSRSRSPPAPEPVPPALQSPVASIIGVEEASRVIVPPLFRPVGGSPGSIHTVNTASHTTDAHVPRHIVPGNSTSPKHDNGGSTQLSRHREQPTSPQLSSLREKPTLSLSRATPVCATDSGNMGAAANKRRQRHQYQQQQSSCAILRHVTPNCPSGVEERGFHHSQASRPGVARTAIDSEGYTEKRKKRAALSEDAVRQLGNEQQQYEAFIESSATKMAQMLLRRLAARKQQSTAAKTATAPATDKSGESLPPSEKGQRADGHNYREADGQYPSLAARLWRKPWRPGGGGENCWEEEDRRFPEESCHNESGSPAAAARVGEDVYRACARAAVGKIVRRACLNLVNRPWRLAGVRLASDPPLAGGKRRRAGGARTDAKSCIAALVKDVSEAVRRNAAASSPETAFCRLVPQERDGGGGGGGGGDGSGGGGGGGGDGGGGVSGGGGGGGGGGRGGRGGGGGWGIRGCRRLVRRNTSPDAGRKRLGKPSRPPYRSRRRPPPTREKPTGRDSTVGGGVGKHNGPQDIEGACQKELARDRGTRWRPPTSGKFGFTKVGGFDEHEETPDSTIRGPAVVPEEELETSGDGWIPSLADYREDGNGTQEDDGGRDQAEPKWWPEGHYSGGASGGESRTALTPCRQPGSQPGVPSPRNKVFFRCPDSPRPGEPRPEQPESREFGYRTTGGGVSAGLGRLKTASRPRRSFAPRAGGHRRRGGRPRWDHRFGVSTRDATPRLRETGATSHRSRSPSPLKARHTQDTSAGAHVTMVPAVPGAPTAAEVPTRIARDVAARSKLAQLKREHILREIGRESCSVGPAAGKIDLIVSELCTIFVDTSPSTEFDASNASKPMLPGEDLSGVGTMSRVQDVDRATDVDMVEYFDKEVPDPRRFREHRSASSPDRGGFDPGAAASNTERQGWTEGGTAEARASRGMLLEFVWPPAQRSARQGLEEAGNCPEWTGFSPRRGVQGQLGPTSIEKPNGIGACGCCRGDERPSTAATFVTATAVAADADADADANNDNGNDQGNDNDNDVTADSQRCSANPPLLPQQRRENRSAQQGQQVTTSHGHLHHARGHSPDRSSASFLVLTLGFLRRLVEVPLSTKNEQRLAANHGSERGLKVGARGEERVPDSGNSSDWVGRDSGQREQPPPAAALAPAPPWRDLADGLEKINMLDAEQGLHVRLVDEMAPNLVESLVPLIVEIFRPPPDVFHWCKVHHGSSSSSSSGSACCCGSSEVGFFLGSVVRELLASKNDSRAINATTNTDRENSGITIDRDKIASNNDRKAHATNTVGDHQRQLGVGVSDVSDVADTAPDGHLRMPTPETTIIGTNAQRRDSRESGARGAFPSEVSSLPSQLGFTSVGGKDTGRGASVPDEPPEDDLSSSLSSSLSSRGDSATTFLNDDASVISSITSHSAHTATFHPPTLIKSTGSFDVDTNGDVQRKNLLLETPTRRNVTNDDIHRSSIGESSTRRDYPGDEFNRIGLGEISARRDSFDDQEAAGAAAEMVSIPSRPTPSISPAPCRGNNSRSYFSVVKRCPIGTSFDLAVLAEMLRVNTHIEYFGLARDARMFADVLNRLAEGSSNNSSGSDSLQNRMSEGNNSSDSDTTRQPPVGTTSDMPELKIGTSARADDSSSASGLADDLSRSSGFADEQERSLREK